MTGLARAATPPEPAPVPPPAMRPQPVAAAPVAAATAAAPAPVAPQDPLTCLIVDDSRVVRKISRRIVEALGYHVIEAENGEEALGRCRAAMPDLILLDWDMPVMTGIDFIRGVRALPGGDHPRAVFCTSKNEPLDIHRGIAAGANEYIVKPFDEATMRAKLDSIGAI